jgi:hypothetical protein
MTSDQTLIVIASFAFAVQVLDLILTHLGGLRRWWQPEESSSGPSGAMENGVECGVLTDLARNTDDSMLQPRRCRRDA